MNQLLHELMLEALRKPSLSLSLSVSANGNHSCLARVSDISSRSDRHAAIFLHFASRFVPKSAIFESIATVELETLLAVC